MQDSEGTIGNEAGTVGSPNNTTNPDANVQQPSGPRRRRAASRPAGPPAPSAAVAPAESATAGAAETPPAKAAKAPAKRTRKAAKTAQTAPAETSAADSPDDASAPRSRTRGTKAARAAASSSTTPDDSGRSTATDSAAQTPDTATAQTPVEPSTEAPAPSGRRRSRKVTAPVFVAPEIDESVAIDQPQPAAPAGGLLFRAPEPVAVPEAVVVPEATTRAPARRRGKAGAAAGATADAESVIEDEAGGTPGADEASERADGTDEDGVPRRKRRRRGGRGRRRHVEDGSTGESAEPSDDQGESPAAAGDEATGTADSGEESGAADDGDADSADGTTRRRRRRRRKGSGGDGDPDDPERTVVHVREPRDGSRKSDDEVTGVRGSTRLEAKKQRRREGRDAGRRRPPVLTEAEFLSRRESVRRVMVVRQRGDLTQIAVLEDGVLVEHYVATSSSTTMVGNVFLGKVQNVLPSMEAAFVDIGRGRNAVLYAGEVNWDAAGLEGQPRRIEHVLKSGDSVLAQVTKDPVGHKGSRLTSNVSLAGRFLVYVPDGSMNGISRKLPDTERTRLKSLLKSIVPDDAGVIVRTAAEGATEEQLTRDVNRLHAQWEEIEKKAKSASPPSLLYAEPDLTVRVVRDLFNEDFESVVVSGDEAWDTIQAYVEQIAPDLIDRVHKYAGTVDAFTEYRVDEQIAKGLDRKVWLPSGGSLVIDRTEAMTVVDVNTGKFVGKGASNLEETVTRNNLEAAEEVVRQLRLRDIGGIIVIDFIDMVLESNRDLVLRRLTECLGRDRTKHQVAEVTSLGLVQMTRKRIGQGLLEAFSEPCEVCNGRGVVIHMEPLHNAGPAPSASGADAKAERRGRSGRRTKTDEVDRAAEAARAAERARVAAQIAAASAHAHAHDDDARDDAEALESPEDAAIEALEAAEDAATEALEAAEDLEAFDASESAGGPTAENGSRPATSESAEPVAQVLFETTDTTELAADAQAAADSTAKPARTAKVAKKATKPRRSRAKKAEPAAEVAAEPAV
jgi:ribonuclease E